MTQQQRDRTLRYVSRHSGLPLEVGAMDLGRFLVEAVVVSGASPSELARSHPISGSWLF
jgi:hypothetical protein